MDNLKEFNSMSSGDNKMYKIIIGILVVILIGFGILFINQYQKTSRIIAELNDTTEEKAELTSEYENLLVDYDDIETTNDSITAQLAEEKERIAELLEDLKTTKAQNRSEIRKYKKELQTLRDIMKGFVRQIDELNTKNIELTAENKQIKRKFNTERSKAKQLTEDLESEKGKVAIASVFRAIDIAVLSYNHKGKSTNRAKKVKRLAVQFTLDENAIAKQGNKDVFVRFTDPNNHVLIQADQPMFTYEGEDIAFSSLREVEYEGLRTNAVIYFENNSGAELEIGNYQVDIFCEGHMIGTAALELN